MSPAQVPSSIGGAEVISYVVLDERRLRTSRAKHVIAGEGARRAAGLAICCAGADGGFYLFGCDADWHAVTDTWHESAQEAKAQASFEYEVPDEAWIDAA
jgi:hypothetical protein